LFATQFCPKLQLKIVCAMGLPRLRQCLDRNLIESGNNVAESACRISPRRHGIRYSPRRGRLLQE
jgi:hypothetical protein